MSVWLLADHFQVHGGVEVDEMVGLRIAVAGDRHGERWLEIIAVGNGYGEGATVVSGGACVGFATGGLAKLSIPLDALPRTYPQARIWNRSRWCWHPDRWR